MPLSEHEQRLLEQMEQALYAEDPKFASTLRGADIRRRYRRLAILAATVFLVGIVLLLLGVVTKLAVISVIGFLVMLGSALLAVTSWRHVPVPGDVASTGQVPTRRRAADRTPGRATRSAPRRTVQRGARKGVMARIEQRWNRRREGEGR